VIVEIEIINFQNAKDYRFFIDANKAVSISPGKWYHFSPVLKDSKKPVFS